MSSENKANWFTMGFLFAVMAIPPYGIWTASAAFGVAAIYTHVQRTR